MPSFRSDPPLELTRQHNLEGLLAKRLLPFRVFEAAARSSLGV